MAHEARVQVTLQRPRSSLEQVRFCFRFWTEATRGQSRRVERNCQEATSYVDEIDLSAPTYRYFYDGQMMQEDDKTIPNLMGAPTISGNSYARGRGASTASCLGPMHLAPEPTGLRRIRCMMDMGT